MPLVRTTLDPSQIREVSETEFTDLERYGLICEVVSFTNCVPAPLENPNVPVRTVGTSTGEITTTEGR